jgi:hypothetical protein
MAHHRLLALILTIAAWLGWICAAMGFLVIVSALATLIHGGH